MIIALWVVTGVLAALFAMAGFMKVITPYGQVREKMAWVETVNAGQLKTIGALEVLGAVGMVLPAATGIAPWLTPLAAAGLFMMMVVATILHVRRKESVIPGLPLGLAALALSIGWTVFA